MTAFFQSFGMGFEAAWLLSTIIGILVIALPLMLAVAVVTGVPLGLLMGAQAPLGVKLIDARSPELIPWCWGINGVASVVARGS